MTNTKKKTKEVNNYAWSLVFKDTGEAVTDTFFATRSEARKAAKKRMFKGGVKVVRTSDLYNKFDETFDRLHEEYGDLGDDDVAEGDDEEFEFSFSQDVSDAPIPTPSNTRYITVEHSLNIPVYGRRMLLGYPIHRSFYLAN